MPPLRDKPSYCYDSGCPLAEKSKGFALGCGSPSSLIGILFERPANDEIDYMFGGPKPPGMTPQRWAELNRWQREEIERRVRAFSHLLCSVCQGTIDWYGQDKKLQELQKTFSSENIALLRQSLGKKVPDSIPSKTLFENVRSHRSTKSSTAAHPALTKSGEEDVSRMQKTISSNLISRSGRPDLFSEETKVLQQPLCSSGTDETESSLLQRRVSNDLHSPSTPETETLSRTSLAYGEVVGSQAASTRTGTSQKRDQGRQSSLQSNIDCAVSASGKHLLSLLPQNVLSSLSCIHCGALGSLSWALEMDPRFYSHGAPVRGMSGSEIRVWILPAIGGGSLEDFFLENVLHCAAPGRDDKDKYPTGDERKAAEACCSHWNRLLPPEGFVPVSAVVSLHPASLIRDTGGGIVAWPLQVDTFVKARTFAKSGKRVLILAGGVAAKFWLGYAEAVTKWAGHYIEECERTWKTRMERIATGLETVRLLLLTPEQKKALRAEQRRSRKEMGTQGSDIPQQGAKKTSLRRPRRSRRTPAPPIPGFSEVLGI